MGRHGIFFNGTKSMYQHSNTPGLIDLCGCTHFSSSCKNCSVRMRIVIISLKPRPSSKEESGICWIRYSLHLQSFSTLHMCTLISHLKAAPGWVLIWPHTENWTKSGHSYQGGHSFTKLQCTFLLPIHNGCDLIHVIGLAVAMDWKLSLWSCLVGFSKLEVGQQCDE